MPKERFLSEAPTVVDLFCGAGGMALGFQRAGFRCIAAFDAWEAAVRTFNANLGQHARRVTITRDLEIPDATIIVGGPPCQGFSSAGLRRTGDERNSLVSVFAEIVARSKPKAFVFENVEGFLTAAAGEFVRDLLEPLVAVGYRIHLRKVNAANFGVAQHRKRVIAVGGLGWEPSFPLPTHSAFGAPGAHRATEMLPVSPAIWDALAGLPEASAEPPGNPQGHYRQMLRGLDLERARLLKQGQTMRDLPQELWHESYKRRAYRRVMDGTPSEKRGGAPAGLRRLEASLPSKAITGGALAEFLHPHQDRPLTIRECARLQSFPDGFVFEGPAVEQIQLIGNAVPPCLAEKIASGILADLDRPLKTYPQGALASFTPAFNSGMSPALQSVVEMVNLRFRNMPGPRQAGLWD